MNPPKMTAEQFLQWRLDMKLTQDDAARMLGYKNRSSICNLEKGVASITPRLALLCQMLKEKS